MSTQVEHGTSYADERPATPRGAVLRAKWANAENTQVTVWFEGGMVTTYDYDDSPHLPPLDITPYARSGAKLWVSENMELVEPFKTLAEAKSEKREQVETQTQGKVNAIVKPPKLQQGLARMNELLMQRILSGRWTPEEAAEVAGYQATLNTTRAIRVREATAEAAIEAAATVAEVEAVTL